jgi:hypothetical protein
MQKTTIIQVVDIRTSLTLPLRNDFVETGADSKRSTSRAINRLLSPVTVAEIKIKPKRPSENPCSIFNEISPGRLTFWISVSDLVVPK